MAQMMGYGLVLGLGATILMDLWSILLNRLAGLGMPNWGLVGRWAANLTRGQVYNDDIRALPRVSGEKRLGWAVHYGVGMAYGVIFLAIAGTGWLERPNALPALGFGLVTILAGWFLTQPGLGLGLAAARAPKPWVVRGLGLAAHSVFGLGLWGTALLL